MIPTGEHQALFAPERRRDQDGVSPFDEVHPECSFGRLCQDNSWCQIDPTGALLEPMKGQDSQLAPNLKCCEYRV
jgi:hypothetical protein